MDSLKSRLLDDNRHYIVDFDFTCVLPTDEAAMLNYIIDLCDFKCSIDVKMTPSFIQRKRPKWTTYFIRKTIKNLINADILIEVSNDGRGKTYRLNEESIWEMIDEHDKSLDTMITETQQSDYRNSTIRLSKFDNQIIENQQQSRTNNQEHTKEHNQDIKISETKVSDKKSSEKYSKEIEEIIDYFNKVTGQKLRSKSKGHRKLITARLNEGFTVDDFKVIIDKKYAEWKDDEKMSKYVTPSTLFRESHFDTYLNQQVRVKVKSAQEEVTSKKWDGTLVTDEVF